jgi:dipeptidyl-peptidase-4
MAFANIHAGEVDGKEAVLMLARDIALADEKLLLKKVVLVIVPILNADGNEKINRSNRPEQNGPVNGVGVRTNAEGFDLNRDFIKLETPEIQALTKAINSWNPAVIIDMHTTNGSYHRYALTYDGPRHPNADAAVISTVRDKWLPEIGMGMEKSTGYRSFFYGDFSADHKSWVTYPALPRYGIQCFAMRNQIGILSESYTYDSFKDRIDAGKAFVRSILNYVAAHPDDVQKLLADARKPRDRIELRVKSVAVGGERTLLGFVEELKDGRWVATKQTKDYSGRYLGGVATTLTVQRPLAYLLPSASAKVLKNLQRHGIIVEELQQDHNLDVQVYKVEKWTRAQQLFQKHNLTEVEVSRRDETRKVSAGTVLIRTEQPLGSLASYLVEPQAEDGLTAWNFFDEALADGKDFPVIRRPKSIPLDREAVRPLRQH